MAKPVVQGPAPQQTSAELLKARAEVVGVAASEALKDDTVLLRQQVAMLEQELADSEHTHQLRSAACCCPCTWHVTMGSLSVLHDELSHAQLRKWARNDVLDNMSAERHLPSTLRHHWSNDMNSGV